MHFIILIIFSLIYFVYVKVQQLKAKGPGEANWYRAKGNIAIGVFFISFGLASYIALQTPVALGVAIFFSIFGLINIIFGIKNYRFHLPYARKEVEQNSEKV